MMLTMDKFRWREGINLALPKEHGSWSLALEPLALGLLVAPTAAGGALAVAAVAGFFLRRPLKILSREQNYERWKIARDGVLILVTLGTVGLLLAAKLGGVEKLWPLLPSAVAGLVFVWCDRRNEAREGAVEVAGAAAFGMLPATFGTLAGWGGVSALALAAVMLVRSISTVLTVRANVRLRKGKAAPILPAFLSAGVGLALCGGLVWLRLAPWAAVFFAGVLAARTVWLLAWRPYLSARTVGTIEAALGGAMVLTLAATWKLF